MTRRPAPRRLVLRAAALAAALTLAAGCGREEEVRVAAPELLELEADQVMLDVEHVLTREGVRRAHLEADTAYFLDSPSSVRMRRYTIDFFGSQGQRTSTLTAVDGMYELQSGDMKASEDVVVVDADRSQRLLTKRLEYDAQSNRLMSNVDFLLIRGRDTVRGSGFVTDPGLDSLTTTRPQVVSPPTGASDSRPGGSPDTTGRDASTSDTLPAAGDRQPSPPGPSATDREDGGGGRTP